MGNPIIEFKQRENDELKTTGGGNNQKPQFVLTGKELEQHITFLIIVGRKSLYFSEGLDSPSLRQ